MPNEINYLRISITDRCNLRCFYCTPWGGWQKLPAPEILRYEELLHLAGVAARVGLRKIRVTGGEPLVRRGAVEFIRNLHQVPGYCGSPLTTNGVLLRGAGPGPLRHRTAPSQPEPGQPAPGTLPSPDGRRPPVPSPGRD